MCCYSDKRAKTDLLARFGKRKTLVLWKVVRRGGRAEFADHRYGPGVHVAKTRRGKAWTGKYDTYNPCGIHVFLDEYYAREIAGAVGKWVVIPVIARRGDLVRAGGACRCGAAVFRRITIRKKDWERVMGA